MNVASCPTRDDLRAFARGELADGHIEQIGEHLEGCTECDTTVALFDEQSDTFVDKFRAASAEGAEIDDPEFDRAVARINAIGHEPVESLESAAEEHTAALPGHLRDYRLLARLGEGGMGMVYKALHTKLQRVVALKVLPVQHRRNAASITRFQREIEAVGQLDHPNVVRAFDAGEDDDMHYLVMELVDGVDVHTLVKQHGPLPVADACEIVRQAALGLQHAHEHGLVHRDLKPSNLMLASGGRSQESGVSRSASGMSALPPDPCPLTPVVKILDLGLALLPGEQMQDREEITATGQVMGTLDYMAPEQADDSHGVDIRADIYALGCTLYKLLTGRAPFSGPSYNSIAKKLRGHAENAPPPVREARPEVPESVADLIARMLAKSSEDRPATPAEVAAALEPLCNGCDLPALISRIAIPAQPDLDPASQAEIAMMLPTPKSIAKKDARRRLGIFAAVASSILFLAVAAAVVISIRRGDGRQTTVEVPDGSQARIDESGNVAVELPDGSTATEPKEQTRGSETAEVGPQANPIMVEKVVRLLGKPVADGSVSFMTVPLDVVVDELLSPFEESDDVSTIIDKSCRKCPVTFDPKEGMTLGAVLAAIEDLCPQVRFVIRDYGLAAIPAAQAKGKLLAVKAWRESPAPGGSERPSKAESVKEPVAELPASNPQAVGSVRGDVGPMVAGLTKPEALELQVDRLIEEAGKLLQTNPARGIPALRAELERIAQLPDLDPAQRLVLTDRIETTINKLQGFADRRTKWKTDVQAAIAEAKELAATDPQAAARRLYGASGRADNASEILGMGAAFFHDRDLLQLSNEYESLAKKLDPKGEMSRRIGAERWVGHVQDALNAAMAEIRTPPADTRASSVAQRIVKVQHRFSSCRCLAREIEDEQVLAETSRKIDDAQRQFAEAVRWSFRNPFVLDSYEASGPLAWSYTGHGLVLVSGRRAGSGPLDLWHGAPCLVDGGDSLGLRRLGTVGNAGWPLVSATEGGTRIAELAGIDGDTLTLRIRDYLVERDGVEPQPQDTKWQLKSPIRVDRAGSAVMHAHTSFRGEKDGKLNHVVSLFLRLVDKENADRSQLLFVRSTDGGKTWPEPPKLVASDVRWPGPVLRPVCFHPRNGGGDTVLESPDHLICLAMNGDDKAVFFRTHDGGSHWTEEIVLLPDPETGETVRGIPLASPNPGISLVYAIPTGDVAAQKYHLCHAWTDGGGRSWRGATTISSDLALTDDQLYSIRTCRAGVMAVTCPVACDRTGESQVQLLLSIDEGARTWRAIPLDERLGGRVGLTALRDWGHCRIFLAAEVKNPTRTANRHQLIVQEIAPAALEFANVARDEKQNASSNDTTTNRGG